MNRLFMALGAALALFAPSLRAQSAIPADWCHALPRPEYRSLERIFIHEPWFEIYKISPGVYAIYEPHQAEEVISYLIVGTKQALLFDTGMGIGNLQSLVSRLAAACSCPC